jgi:hypothetical protein
MSFGVLDREREDRAFGGRPRGRRRARRERASAPARSCFATTRRRAAACRPRPRWRRARRPCAAASGGVAWHAGAYVEAEHAPLPASPWWRACARTALPGETAPRWIRASARRTRGRLDGARGGGHLPPGQLARALPAAGPRPAGGTPRRAEHLVAGVERGGTLSLRLEAYLKRYDDYAPAGDGPPSRAGTNRRHRRHRALVAALGPGGWLSYSLLRGAVELEDGRVCRRRST